MVGHGPYANNEAGRANLDFERLDGELDAATVFAAAAKKAYQNNEAELGHACFSDAEDIYTRVISSLADSALPVEQQEYLRIKANNVRECLERVHLMALPSAGEAA